MAENFNLIFGSQAPTTASWSDADYQTGWNVVGSTPPTAEQFDALQNRADKKAQELNNRMLPLEQKAEEQGRQTGTAYTVGAAVTVDGLPADWLLVCTTAGTSGTVSITLPNPLLDGATINDGTITWTLRKIATNGSLGYRQPSTTYTAGQIAYHSTLPTGWYLECTTAGTTGSGDLTISSPSIGGTVSDGTVVWTIHGYIVHRGHISDANDATGDGIYFATSQTANLPTSVTWSDILTLGTPTFAFQTCYPSALDNIFTRRKINENAWTNWVERESIVAKSLGENGYIKYASGLIIQWGRFIPTPTSTWHDFPISFTYTPVITSDYWLSGNDGVAKLNGLSNTRFNFLGSRTDSELLWIAIGY